MPARKPPPTLLATVRVTARASSHPIRPTAETSIDSPKDEEEERCEDVAEAEEALLDLLARPRLGEDDTSHQRTDRFGQSELAAEGRAADDERENGEEEYLARKPVEEKIYRPPQPLRNRESGGDESDCLGDDPKCVHELAPAARGESEDERDHDVLHDEYRKHEIGLVVCEAAEVDQPLHGDRRRGDVNRGCENERAETQSEGRDSDD